MDLSASCKRLWQPSKAGCNPRLLRCLVRLFDSCRVVIYLKYTIADFTSISSRVNSWMISRCLWLEFITANRAEVHLIISQWIRHRTRGEHHRLVASSTKSGSSAEDQITNKLPSSKRRFGGVSGEGVAFPCGSSFRPPACSTHKPADQGVVSSDFLTESGREKAAKTDAEADSSQCRNSRQRAAGRS